MRIILIALGLTFSLAAEQLPSPPPTEVREVTDVVHGTTIIDPYRWLEDQDSPDTRAWVERQNRYTRAVLDAIPGRAPLQSRISELLRTERVLPPVNRAGRYFYSKRLADEQLDSLYMRDRLQGPERRIIAASALSSDFTKTLEIFDVSPDGRLVAYGIRTGGEDETEVRVLEVDTGRELPDRLPRGIHYAVRFLPDRAGFLYTLRTAAGTRIHEHRMGTSAARDALLFGAEYGDEKLIWLEASDDRRYWLATVAHGAGDGSRAELFFADRTAGTEFRPLVTGIDAAFTPVFGGHRLFVRTNWKAPNWRVVEIDLLNPAPERWREVVRSSDTSQVQLIATGGGKLFVNVLDNVTSRLRVYEPSGELARDIALPTLGSTWVWSSRWDIDEVFYLFTSFAAPFAIYRHVPSSGDQELWFRSEAKGFNPDEIETRQVWYRSKDGTRVPMFIVHRKGLSLDGVRPTLLYGYGGYGMSLTPGFQPQGAIVAERGGVFAVANIRGGGEFGDRWHRDGMLEKKQNSFDDFIAGAEWLISNRYTNPKQLAIQGGSNGGLLVAAAMTQRPELFQAVVCEAPHLDMIRYHRFLQAAPWVQEYGDPDKPAEFAYLYKYSPYHNVRKGRPYPATLLLTGDRDTRVAPLHARKMTALLQASTGSANPILLRYDTQVGHAWGATLEQEIEYYTDVLSFVLWQFGTAGPSSRTAP
jgi:prolyl oligopeptidase